LELADIERFRVEKWHRLYIIKGLTEHAENEGNKGQKRIKSFRALNSEPKAAKAMAQPF
jgi:hypothetical protein